MRFGDILVCIDRSDTGRKRLELAMALARRSGARLTGYYLASQPSTAGSDVVAEEIEAAALAFDQQLTLHDLDGVWIRSASHRVEDIAAHARCVDLVIVGLGVPDDPSLDPQHLDINGLIVACGRPVLGIPIVDVQPDFKRVMVAWDGGREAARALGDAMPFLKEASSVKVVALDLLPTAACSAESVVAHLGRLGIAASVDTAFDLRFPAGEEILSRVEREDIDLLVAGAFGHSRMRERLVGGASATLLHQMMVPVLASH